MKPPLVLLILAFVFVATSYRLYRPGIFSMSDDMHIFRQQQFDQCLGDHQIPCRLIRDGGLGYGYPLFNYYPPLSYVVGEAFHLSGFSFVDSIRLVFIVTLLLGTVGSYLLGSELFGRFGGLVVSILFSFAPYRALDVYVRGALAESLALNLVPLFFYLGLRLLAQQSRLNHLLFVLITSALLLSHNLIAVLILPLFFIFSLFFNPHRLKTITLVYFQSLLLAAFFLLPAIIEKNLVTINTMTQGYFQFTAHFATLKQLFWDRSWGYGASLWGPKDDLSFQVGLLQWLLPLLLLAFISTRKILLFFFICASFFIFLTHSRSTPIWQLLPIMPYFQFPWRFLGPSVFCLSLVSGSTVYLIKSSKHQITFTLVILITATLLNFNYFHEDIWYSHLTDQEKLNQENIFKQSNAGLQDYWPKFGQTYPKAFASNIPAVVAGSATITSYTRKSNASESQIRVLSDLAAIRFPQVYFPNLNLRDNGRPLSFNLDPELGLVVVKLTSGDHRLRLQYQNTPIRNFANTLSLIGLITLFPSLLLIKYET